MDTGAIPLTRKHVLFYKKFFCDQAVLCNIHVWFKRASTHENISDLPSREEYALLERLRAVWVPPMVAKVHNYSR